MFIDGYEILRKRIELGIGLEELASSLGLKDEELREYEKGKLWKEDDPLALAVLESLFLGDSDLSYIIPTYDN